jgi:hypothetical protein
MSRVKIVLRFTIINILIQIRIISKITGINNNTKQNDLSY